jgi:tetratricopeptide (TPR) repeat protein
MLDGHGNPIVRRNAFMARAVAWVNLIPPGAASVAHFRLAVPEDCGETLTLEARLNYRKFTHVNTQFAFAGRPAEGEPDPGPGVDRVTPHYDDRVWVDGEVPRDVSAEVREIPDLPSVVMSVSTATLRVVGEDMVRVNGPLAEARSGDWMRWNDYGIGLLLQGDFQGARRAFERVVAANPTYADGYVNLARGAVQEGLIAEAKAHLVRAFAHNANLASAHYFMGVILKEEGDYAGALEHLRTAATSYPKDRVVRNTIGRILFLQREFEAAIIELRQVLTIDPEDLAAHYNLMLCYKGLGRVEEASVEEQLYLRFKADEDSNIILGPYLQANPEDNRMRQMIHEQVSVSPEIIAAECAIREREGEPLAVLPGQAAEYAKRVVEEGRRKIAEGKGSDRHLGPVEADEVRVVDLEDIVAQRAVRQP